MGLVLRGGILADPRAGTVEAADLRIEGDVIADLGEGAEGAGDVSVDCSGCLVIPGNVCAHTHLYSALARGMPAPCRAPRNFSEILELIWWRLDRALDEASIQSSALCGVMDAIRAGTTTLVDHHASPNFIDGSLDILADAFERIGARGVLCYEVTDRGGPERSRAGIRENVRFIRDNGRALVRGMMGAHASFTLDDGTLEEVAGEAQALGSGVHIHVAEDECDELDSMRRSGRRTTFRLDAAHIFGDRSIAAHGVHLNDDELSVLQKRETWIVHNCRSNLNNGVGRAPLRDFGPRAALGTDGIDGDMFSESRTAFFRAREDSLDASADRTLGMLTAGAALAESHFDDELGSLRPGSVADLVVLEYKSPTPLDAANFPWHWMFAFGAGAVRDVLVAGRWVLRERDFPDIDEAAIRAGARREAAALWDRMAVI